MANNRPLTGPPRPSTAARTNLDLRAYVDVQELLGVYRVAQAIPINVLFIGRSGCGKSTFVKQLLDPTCGTVGTSGYSTTKDPEFHTSTLMDAGNKPYQLNLLDTPGLGEHRKETQGNRSDEELVLLSMKCLQHNITFLNVVVFVTKAGDTHEHDIKVFKMLLEKLGRDFGEITMLLLTHSEELSDERKQQFKTDLSQHPDSKPIYDYCKLGLFFGGAINIESIRELSENDNVRKEVATKRSSKVRFMREAVVNEFIRRAGKPKDVVNLAAVHQEQEKHIAKLIEEALKKRCAVM